MLNRSCRAAASKYLPLTVIASTFSETRRSDMFRACWSVKEENTLLATCLDRSKCIFQSNEERKLP
jgi:hypothetical protein